MAGVTGHHYVLADFDADGQAGHVVGGNEDLAEGNPHGAAGEFFDAAHGTSICSQARGGMADEVALA